MPPPPPWAQTCAAAPRSSCREGAAGAGRVLHANPFTCERLCQADCLLQAVAIGAGRVQDEECCPVTFDVLNSCGESNVVLKLPQDAADGTDRCGQGGRDAQQGLQSLHRVVTVAISTSLCKAGSQSSCATFSMMALSRRRMCRAGQVGVFRSFLLISVSSAPRRHHVRGPRLSTRLWGAHTHLGHPRRGWGRESHLLCTLNRWRAAAAREDRAAQRHRQAPRLKRFPERSGTRLQ